MRNLLKETIDDLAKNGKTLDDVAWIGCKDFMIPMDEFLRLADANYDDGYGGTEVADDLVVVGDGWWLERHNYDGSEWWEYKEQPKTPNNIKHVNSLVRTDESDERRFSSSNIFYNSLIHMATD